MSRVLVTGASGYLASHIVKQLLESGEYVVRGTVRSLKNEQKVKPLKSLCPNAKHELELVEADLLKKESWIEAVKDCTYVLHVASPFPISNPTDEMELIQPAVEGTRNVLDACAKTKGVVKRVVVTSSGAAVYGGRIGEEKVFTEEDWAIEECCSPYLKSKLLAERAAWKFVEELPDDEKFELSVVNPTFIMGPVLKGSSCTSIEIEKRFLERQMPMVPKLSMGVCDVRDVATAHITAMTSPKAAGNRYIACTESMWMEDLAKILDQEFRPQGYNVPTRPAPKFLLKIMSWFDATVKMILPELGHELKFSNSKIKQDLGYEPTNVKDTINDMGYSLIDSGFVKKTAQYRGKHKQEDGTETAASS